MTIKPEKPIRVLAVDPTTNGFGFAVTEGKTNLIDWGVKEATGNKYAVCLKLILTLIDRYQPEVIVMENPAAGKSRRCERVRELIRKILNLSMERRIRTRVYSREQIRDAFAKEGACTKHEIATAIARMLPELEPRLPRYRQAWMSEDSRMAIFDAVGMALTFFHFQSRRKEHTLSALGINNHV